jgi:DnaJ-class molecular chaperone
VIVLEVTDDSGVTHYQFLELDPAVVVGLDDKAADRVVERAARAIKKKFSKAMMHGDEAALELTTRVNVAVETLMNKAERQKYDETLAAGAGDQAAILQAQKIGSPFFWERAIRFRVVEQLMPVMPDEG